MTEAGNELSANPTILPAALGRTVTRRPSGRRPMREARDTAAAACAEACRLRDAAHPVLQGQ